ncbi:MAG TPA: hypothetical protein DCM86_07615 [Verrucomicrobiales bacterium]|nr:hypothetical protein [Verrucomicrobiales bacterium]
MSPRTGKLLLGALLLTLGLALWRLWPVSPREQVQLQLQTLASLWNYGPGESPIHKKQALARMKSLLSPDIVVEINLQHHAPHQLQGRHGLMEGIEAIRFSVEELHIELFDYKIEILPDGTHANVSMAMEAKIGPEKQEEFQELKSTLERSPDGWVITRVQTVKTWGR